MRLELRRMTLENFKGIKNRVIDFDSKLHRINGKNATGKTTIANGYFLVFCNTDYDLKLNPAIFPIDVEECTPSVEIEMLVDDKPVKICKKQTRKITESNGTKKIALTNSYLVNDVPMAERDMIKKLSDMGFDFDNFAILANPNAFLLEKKDIQRKILFSMVAAYTDSDIASRMDNVDEAKELLANYTVDEIRAMQNATLRKITENYGKKGELLNSKIEGLELSKIDLDFAELELQRNLIKDKIEKNQDAQRIGDIIESQLNELKEKDMSLQFELSGIEQKEEAEKHQLEVEAYKKRRNMQDQIDELNRSIPKWNTELIGINLAIGRLEDEVKVYEQKLSDVKAQTFNDDDTFCPVCHRVYESDKIEEMKKHFETDKRAKISSLEQDISEHNSIITFKYTERADLATKMQKAENDKAELEKTLKDASKDFTEILNVPSHYQAEKDRIKKLIAANAKAMEEKKAGLPIMTLLKSEELKIHGELRECEIKLSKADDNIRIDEKIAELRKQQLIYEQDRANAEKILYQLDLIQKEKNLVVTDEINKHFSLVHWKMFDYLKNGSYTETCVPMAGDKELGTALNNAMQIRAKIYICNSLQNFYDIHYPIFLDNSESLDNENQKQLAADTQLILLAVTN